MLQLLAVSARIFVEHNLVFGRVAGDLLASYKSFDAENTDSYFMMR
jgi:hypothetical protein